MRRRIDWIMGATRASLTTIADLATRLPRSDKREMSVFQTNSANGNHLVPTRVSSARKKLSICHRFALDFLQSEARLPGCGLRGLRRSGRRAARRAPGGTAPRNGSSAIRAGIQSRLRGARDPRAVEQ